MAKKGKIIGGIIIGLVAVGAAVGAISAFSNMKGATPPDPQTQLATVQRIEYNEDKNILSWENVNGADSYNVSVNDKVESVNETYYTVDVDPTITDYTVQIQACDSTGTYLSSEWSQPFEITLTKQESLVSAVNEFAKNITGQSYKLKNVVSMHAEDSHLFTTATYEYMGKDYILTYDTDCGETITSLEEALKTQDVNKVTYTDSENAAKNYDTASSFLARSEYSEQIQELADQQYDLSFVTSQAYEITSDTLGIKGILKAKNDYETKYYSVDVSMYVGQFNNEQYKYTNAVVDAQLGGMIEESFVELTGDFKEYAQQLDEMQKSNNISNDLGMSY